MSDDPPAGYLGAEGPVRRGPAPELVAAGYELELADAALLHPGLGRADLAHALELRRVGVIGDDVARPLLSALLALDALDPGELGVDRRLGDLVNLREAWLSERIGPAAGWLSAGRPRREAGRIAFRLALRPRVLDLAAASVRLGRALVDLAGRERDTPMPDYTYLVAAQPTTVGHWALSFVEPVRRDLDRLHADLAQVDHSPAGAGGVNGSRLPLDRERLATVLGFAAVAPHARDATWGTDAFVALGAHAALCAVGASRLAEDLEVYGTAEFGLLRVGDALCRASALMPHKRNPYALVVLRGGASTLIGRATGLMTAQRTPSGRTDNLLHAYGELAGTLEHATRLVALAAAVVESLTVDREAMAAAVTDGFTQAADLAEAIALSTDLDHRSAHRLVGRAVAEAVDAGAGPRALTPERLDAVARELLGRGLDVEATLVADALDPHAALATRTATGGAASAPLAALLEEARGDLDAADDRIDATRARIAAAEEALETRARAAAG